MQNPGAKRRQAGFVIGHGYNSVYSGNFYTFLGVCEAGLFHFYRRFSGDWHRLTKKEALYLFDVGAGRCDNDYSTLTDPDIECYIIGGRI